MDEWTFADYEEGDVVIAAAPLDDVLKGKQGVIAGIDDEYQLLLVEFDDFPGGFIGMSADELSPVFEEDTDTLPPFGMHKDDLAAYASVVVERLYNRVGEAPDNSGTRGFMNFETADLVSVVEAARYEVDQAMIGLIMVHLRLTRLEAAAVQHGLTI